VPAYELQSTDELLGILAAAGRAPDPDLVRACLTRGPEVVPTLLVWLDEDESEEWEDDDPRWYRAVHAALILIGLREPAALPSFRRHMYDEDDYLTEWISGELPAYGPIATDWAIEILQDSSAPEFARNVMAETLGAIGWHHPDELERILPALRAVLPPLDPSGEVVLPDEASRDEPEPIWSWAASSLADLRDLESQPAIKALYQADLIDEWVMGDLEDYLDLFRPDAPPPIYDSEPYDIPATYEGLRRQAASERARLQTAAPPVWDDRGYSAPVVFEPYVRTTPKVGRNDPCPCGSGKKYKYCHGKS
jgi:hypothetical protein